MNNKHRLTLLIVVVSTLCLSCGADDTTVVVIGPQKSKLPKIDCEEYLRRVSTSLAARGLNQSGIAARTIAQAERDCADENKRRGY